MKFTISSIALLKQLQVLQGVIARSNPWPILDNILFDLSKGTLTLTASDLETTIVTNVPVEGNDKGAVTLPAKRLVKILRMLPGQHLTISISKDSRARITGDQGSYEIAGEAVGEYPKTQEVDHPTHFENPASALSRGIGKTLWAAGNDHLRPVMAGVYFDMSETGSRFVATDAHCLVVIRRDDVKAPPAQFVLPSKSAKLLAKQLSSASGNVAMELSSERVLFSFDNLRIYARLVNGKYPNIDAVIPKETPNRITVDRLQLLGCVRRLHLFANTTTHQLKFNLNGSIQVSAEDLDDGFKASEQLAGTYKGEAMNIGFNARFLDEVLRNLNCQEVEVQMNRPNNAALFVPTEQGGDEHITTLVMPVMLND